MNDLMPPPRRPMPPHQRDRVRAGLLSAETPPHRRAAVPVLAAAAVGVIAVGGVAVASQLGGDDQNGLAPAGASESNTAPTATVSPTQAHRTSAPPETTPTTVAAENPYDKCIALVRQTPQRLPLGDPRGRLMASTEGLTTVVVGDGRTAWACNVDPDEALSQPVPDEPPAEVNAQTFAFAFNVASNFDAGDGDLSWAGGVLPKGVTGLTYLFPDGHEEPAVTEDGYWVMQYLSEQEWMRNVNTTDPVQVLLHGPGGDRTVIVPLGPETICNQVTHGC